MTSYALPSLSADDPFAPIPALAEARGEREDSLIGAPPGRVLEALREAAPEARAAIAASGMPDAIVSCDLVTLPYPTRYGLWRAALSPAPYLWFTNRMVVVQWVDGGGVRRTLLFEPTDVERAQYTPYFADLSARTGPLQDRLVTRHGTVLAHLRALGIAPEDVDYLAFDHLHTQDVRRLVGTTRPAEDLDSPDEPVTAWFPNARLIVQQQEWEGIRYLHPLQARWFQPRTYLDLDVDRLLPIHGDVLVGPGVGFVATPGHTLGNMSLVVNTPDGIWVSSENGVAAESWAPQASRIPGVRRFASQWQQEVVMNANTIELASWQYDSMVLEAALADREPGGVFPLCLPSSELIATRKAPLVSPTHRFGGLQLGEVRGRAIDLEDRGVA